MSHLFPCEVYYEDTDLSGFVYHANYLKFIERARSAWVAGLGVDQNAMREAGLVFAVRRIEADFLAPARLGDALEVETRVASQTAARMVLAQRVLRGDVALFEAQVTLVAMGTGGRPVRLPEALRRA
ncbi:tol-pal system-associated acyl-CoA thioesterase [Oceanicola sp. D3]|uniref:tol-pal system-associated acyl-CoA thioesterase n=1 Tax=Oceanicola sp. D3 TaxID=2587163 RepID=UPI0011242DF2|nr:tol-pal system-associated acyl-CoA thioesterase [Oceanicola sp. D3]QDC10978.1 tol-pal system-associated acyl-CoA thioesterase [Oceanicola sp. D3]